MRCPLCDGDMELLEDERQVPDCDSFTVLRDTLYACQSCRLGLHVNWTFFNLEEGL